MAPYYTQTVSCLVFMPLCRWRLHVFGLSICRTCSFIHPEISCYRHMWQTGWVISMKLTGS